MEDIETESSKGKNNEILDFFNNYNKLRSTDELNEIQDKSNELKFKIDETNRTISLFKVNCFIDEVIISRTIEHESKEYFITSISTNSRIKTQKLVEDKLLKY